MAGTLLWAALLLGAPEGEGARLLKTAWASQYEWKEDGVKNVTLGFRYEIERKGARDFTERQEGEGQIVIVGNEIVRRHYRGAASPQRRGEVDPHLDWAIARFMRKPYDEEFKDVKVEEPEEAPEGAKRIRAGRREYYVREDRLLAENRLFDERPDSKNDFRYRLDFKTEKIRDGYGIFAEQASFSREGVALSGSRTLSWKAANDVPMPDRYEFLWQGPGSDRTQLVLRFFDPRANVDDPVTIDPAARDLLKAAWGKRYVLPANIRVEGEFVRKADPTMGRFVDRVEGEFQLWGMDKLTVKLDDKQFRDPSGWTARNVRDQVEGDLRRLFGMLDPRPFDERFKGCGFEKKEGAKEVEILVYGFADALGFRIEEGAISAHLDNSIAADAWWDYRGKATKDGFRVEKLSRKIEGKLYEQQIRYAAFKGVMVPTAFDCFTGADAAGISVYGINEYDLKKLKVEVPK